MQLSTGNTIYTEIIPAGPFYVAEDYHQKYYLRQSLSELIPELKAIYPHINDFTNSTAVTRLNGYAGGYGAGENLEEELELLGLSERGKEIVRQVIEKGLLPACPAFAVTE